MDFKGIIFDLDGVICFTDKYHYKAWKELADKLGIYFDEKINDRLRGVSRAESLEIILEKSDKTYTAEEKAGFAEEKNNLYRRLLGGMSPEDISAEVRETLEMLRGKGVKLAIGSSSKNTPLILFKTDTAKYFDAVSDGNNITRSKPDPEVFLKAAEMLNEPPRDCVIVEDAVSGVQAGKAAGMTTIAIGAAAASGVADYNVTRFAEIADIVLKSV